MEQTATLLQLKLVFGTCILCIGGKSKIRSETNAKNSFK